MSSPSDDHATIILERRVLQALCEGDLNALKAARKILPAYKWQEPIHQIIFSCISGSRAEGPSGLREHLAECATRKGFPDIDLEEFFPPHPDSTDDAETMMHQLLEMAPGETRGQQSGRRII